MKIARISAGRSAAALLFAVLLSWSCSEAPTDTGPASEGRIGLFVDVSSTPIRTLVVEVSADDISPPLTFNIEIDESGIGMGTLAIPAGSDRTITIRAFDEQGIETHRGSATVDIVEGANPPLSITLLPLLGNLEVEVRLGSFVVTVEPEVATVEVGATVQLEATITDGEGNEVEGEVVWATTQPDVATVDETGLVTGVGGGEAEIVANFADTRGSAAVEVVQTGAIHLEVSDVGKPPDAFDFDGISDVLYSDPSADLRIGGPIEFEIPDSFLGYRELVALNEGGVANLGLVDFATVDCAIAVGAEYSTTVSTLTTDPFVPVVGTVFLVRTVEGTFAKLELTFVDFTRPNGLIFDYEILEC